MKDRSPFGLAGIWENWRDPDTGEWERTFAIITVPSNKLVLRFGLHSGGSVARPPLTVGNGAPSIHVRLSRWLITAFDAEMDEMGMVPRGGPLQFS